MGAVFAISCVFRFSVLSMYFLVIRNLEIVIKVMKVIMVKQYCFMS